MRAATQAAVASLGLLGLVLITDRFIQPADTPMVWLSLTALALAVTVVVRTLWPLRHTPSDLQVARYIEERCPDLEDRLASATDITRGGRSAFRGLMMVDAASKARDVDIDLVVARPDVRRAIIRGAVAITALLVMLTLGSGPLGRISRTAWLHAFPYTAALDVEPGDARVVVGQPLRVRATLTETIGAPSRTLPVLTITTPDGIDRTIDMGAVGDGYEVEISAVEEDFTYQVRAASVVSAEYNVIALSVPRVEQIDVAYEYPSFTGLVPRIDTNGGDVYAPAGTRVTVSVHMDKPVVHGGLALGSGGYLALRVVGETTLQGSFEVLGDDTYRVSATDTDGLVSPADVDYFIRTILDRPPEIEIMRPGGDRDMTPLEEVVIEARADDDYGLERFELVYGVVGRPERTISLRGERRATTVSGAYTIFGEELQLQPGDLITYYARARDTNTSAQASETRSDIYFLEVRPFSREFEEAQSQSSSAMDAGEVGRLAEVQKQIIIATWKLDRQGDLERSEGDLLTVANAQGELEVTARRMVGRMLALSSRISPGNADQSSGESDTLVQAAEAMAEAETSLRAHTTQDAIPHEMEALTQLLRAQTQIERTQVAQQGSRGAAGGATGAQEDMSSLFDRELRRDQRTNYEDRPSAAQTAADQDESEAQRRLRELVDRQAALSRRQRELAERQPELDARAVQRRLDRLTREQNEVRQQIEDLRRQGTPMEQQGRGSHADAQAMRDVANQMERALSELRRGDVLQAAQSSQQALQGLRDLQRQQEGRDGIKRRQAIGELQLEAQQLAESQRRMASETRQAGPGHGGREARGRLADQEDQLAARVDSLRHRLENLLPRAGDEERQALTDAARALRQPDVAQRMRNLADELRRGEETDAQALHDGNLERIADADKALADLLERVADHIAGAGSWQDAKARRLSEELEDAQELRRRLEQIEDLLERVGHAGTEPVADRPPSPDSRSARAQQGGGGDGALAQLRQELRRQLAESPELLDRLSRRRPALERDLERWARHWESGAAPGTEAFKQDYAEWVRLRREVQLALDEFELARSRELTEQEVGDRLNVGPSQQTPRQYRRLVEQYYRSLAARPERP